MIDTAFALVRVDRSKVFPPFLEPWAFFFPQMHACRRRSGRTSRYLFLLHKLRSLRACVDSETITLMSPVAEIEAPYVLASLSRPVDSVNGRILGAGVYSLRGSKKRRRFETVVSIDGEGISIHHVSCRMLMLMYPTNIL